jgi:hypothetical protein
MNAAEILQTITLGVSAWALLEIIALKTKLARLEQKLDDLPCHGCPESKTKGKLKLCTS